MKEWSDNKTPAPLFIIFSLGWLILSTVLLTLPGSAFPRQNWLGGVHLDKWIHLLLFGILTFLWCRAFLARPGKWLFIVIAVLAAVYGIAMEFVQEWWIPNRSFEMIDIFADLGGAVLGLGIFWVRYLKK